MKQGIGRGSVTLTEKSVDGDVDIHVGDPDVEELCDGFPRHEKSGRKIHVKKRYANKNFDVLKDEILRMYSMGLTYDQIMSVFGLSRTKFYDWLQDNPEYKAKLESAREIADEKVVASLYQIATGQVVIESTETIDKSKDDVIVKKRTTQIAPSSWAAIKWLAIRQPQRWTEKKEEPIGDVSSMTDEELDATIKKLSRNLDSALKRDMKKIQESDPKGTSESVE